MPTVNWTRTFEKNLRSLPLHRKNAVAAAVEKFTEDPSWPSLRFRPLQHMADHWIISANRGDRIILAKIGEDDYDLADVGPHDNVYRRWNR